jgi:hypothetical protein
MADKLNTAAPIILKLLEEPTEKRFSFLSQKTKISFKPFVSMSSTSFQWITKANIAEALVEKILIQIALKIAHQAQEISTKHCNYYNR